MDILGDDYVRSCGLVGASGASFGIHWDSLQPEDGDPLWANVKSSDGRLVVDGHYPVILACNVKPRIHLDQDTDAWRRILAVWALPHAESAVHRPAETINVSRRFQNREFAA